MKSLRNFVLPSFQALIHDVQVSWLRRRGPEMSLLTTNQLVFSVDTRLGVSRWGTRMMMMMMMMMMLQAGGQLGSGDPVSPGAGQRQLLVPGDKP